jgi:membrane-bound metal-dependent hydrolase YbcI (DUF457 family)
MAGYKGHISGALVFFFVYALGLFFVLAATPVRGPMQLSSDLTSLVALCAICVMFGLWPDVDTNSKGQDIFYALFFVLDVALIYYQRFNEAAYLGLFCILPILGKHRGWTHTYWAMTFIPSPILLLPHIYTPATPWMGLPYYGAALVGYFSHLYMDGLVGGAKPRRRRARPRVTSR